MRSKAMAIRTACFIACACALAPTARGWSGDTPTFAMAPMCAFEVPVSIAVSSKEDGPVGLDGETLCQMGTQEHAGISRRVTQAEARDAFKEHLRLAEHNRPLEALLHLRVVEAAYPHLRDRLALRRADLLMAAGKPAAACEAYGRAAEGLESNVRALAEVGRVRCRIAAGDPQADRALQDLLRAYPELPVAARLRYQLARAEERRGHPAKAARRYRHIDLHEPASTVAARARARLQALAREGTQLPPLPGELRVDRLERLVKGAPPARVKEAMARFDGLQLSPNLQTRVALVSARIAKVEGRFEDAGRALDRARFKATLGEEVDAGRVKRSAQAMANTLQAREREAARRTIARLKGRRPYRALPLHRLLKVLDVAVGPRLTEVVDGVLEALERKRVPAQHRFDAAVQAAGTGSDERVAALLKAVVDDRRLGVPARYHYARTLERLGRWAEAEIHHLRVLDEDTSQLGYYRMWSELRLREVREALVGHCAPEEMRLATLMGQEQQDPLSVACTVDSPRPASARTPLHSSGSEPSGPSVMESPNPGSLASRLAPIARSWEDTYPWFRRAVDLLHLGDHHGASDELHEAFLAWRQAIGRPIRRAGLLAVYRGADLPRQRATWQELRRRRSLERETRQVLADVAAELGDMGVAIGFGGHERAKQRPRPHAGLVHDAARRHGLDPNLLFAVMRVESVYQRRIVSYAGAVGLMQIMPRTGRLIAAQRGRRDFTVDHLLDPAINIEFAAWYLASLIERFDGRLPLAIASYNGGPHNVRRWMHGHAEDMPLDAFLERIPFSQTHRYVRRVLTHYTAYRAQQDLPMPQLAVELPTLNEPDPIGF